MEKLITEDIQKHLSRINKKHQIHPLIALLANLGVSARTMVEIFKEGKEASRGTVYNLYCGYVKTIPRPVENKLLKTLKSATEQAIVVANSDMKNKYKLATLNQIKEAIIESKKFLNGLDEMDVQVFDLGVLEENKEKMNKKDEQFIEAFIDHIAV